MRKFSGVDTMQFPIFPALILGLLFSLCGLSGGGPSPPPSVQPGVSGGDCGVFAADGADCFEAAMQRCNPAKVMLFEQVPPVSAEIKGSQLSTSCAVTVRGLGKAEIDRIMLENSAQQWEVDEMNARIDSSAGFSGLAGLSATCVVDKLKATTFAESYVYVCNGPLIDEIKRLGLAEKFA